MSSPISDVAHHSEELSRSVASEIFVNMLKKNASPGKINRGRVKHIDNRPPETEKSCSGSGRIFLLSPANIAGTRAQLLLNGNAEFELARRLRREGAPLGEVFSFISGLYFRGKLAYAQAFAASCSGAPGILVITAGGGLVPPETKIKLERLREISAADVDLADARYCEPLVRDARILAKAAGPKCQIVLLGSIASPKYFRPLLEIFGESLCFPAEFIGRGDLSRGGLMLRCVRAGVQLTYVPLAETSRHGPRPPKLLPWTRT